MVSEFSMEDAYMESEVNSIEKSLLGLGKPELDRGAITTGPQKFFKSIGLMSTENFAE